MRWRDKPCTEAQRFGILSLLRSMIPMVDGQPASRSKLMDDLANGRIELTRGEASDIMQALHKRHVRRDRFQTAKITDLFPGYFE